MEYTKAELEKIQIHVLRDIGRQLGVKSPSSLKKSQLIEQIMAVDSGRVEPNFTKKGRPSLGKECKTKKIQRTLDDRERFEAVVDMVLADFKRYVMNKFDKIN